MTNCKTSAFVRRSTFAFIAATALFAAAPANAAIYEYDVRGNVASPINVTLRGQTLHDAGIFSLLFDTSNVIATYDDKGTADVSDDTFAMNGIVSGDIRATRPGNYGFIRGSHDFQLDLEVSNPIAGMTPDPGNEFAFSQQAAGTLSVLDDSWKHYRSHGATQTSTLMAKNDKNFAIRVLQDPNDPGALIGEGWIAVMAGFLGAGNDTRWEFGAKNAALNWDFRLERRGTTEVPEPMSAVLLLSGLAGLSAHRRKKNQS